MAETKIYILGVAELHLGAQQRALLNRCRHLFTAQRFAGLVPQGMEIHPITPLQEQLEQIRQLLEENNIAVFASGDPLYYGIVRTLLRHFPADRLCIVPALSSIQRAAALFCIPWDDARLLSLHGRDTLHLPGLFLRHKKSFTLTDATYSPTRIAGEILDYCRMIDEQEEPAQWQVLVAENIGTIKEKTFCGTLAECAESNFAPLNVLALQRKTAPPQNVFAFGLSEQDIQHSRGLITKREVRAATLHALRLPAEGGVFWDVGAGSGSISIEAARMHPQLTIYAIEHKEEELANIKANIRRFRCYNIVPVAGRAPEALAGLPAPDSVFIGGSAGLLAEITAVAASQLASGGRLVINGVIAKTVTAAEQLLTENGFIWESAQVSVIRSDSTGNRQEFNPITIFSGQKGPARLDQIAASHNKA